MEAIKCRGFDWVNGFMAACKADADGYDRIGGLPMCRRHIQDAETQEEARELEAELDI